MSNPRWCGDNLYIPIRGKIQMSERLNSYAQYSYNSQNKIADRDILSNPDDFNPWQLPENPFDYVDLLKYLE
jgi:hypothetical protein